MTARGYGSSSRPASDLRPPPAGPAPGHSSSRTEAAGSRVLFNADGTVDELVVHDASVHVEQMGDHDYQIDVVTADGVWFGTFAIDPATGRLELSEDETGMRWDDVATHGEEDG